MNAKEISRMIFELIVRLMGLLFLYKGVVSLPIVLGQMLGYLSPSSFKLFFDSLVSSAWALALAYWFLTGAPQLMRIVYPDEKKEPEENTFTKE